MTTLTQTEQHRALVANILLGLGMEALAEATAPGRKAGLDTRAMLDALAHTSVVSPSQKGKFDNMIRGEYLATFALRRMPRDFGLVLRLTGSLSVRPHPVPGKDQSSAGCPPVPVRPTAA